jgi:hypothetical protein
VLGDSAYNLTGKLVIANSPVVDDSWTGTILGLAVYDGQLNSSQVEQHEQEWSRGQMLEFTKSENPVALYLFDEHEGRVAYNKLDSVTDLQIPTRYFVLHPRFLTPLWERFRFGWPGWSFWQDAILNIAGFIPVGLATLNCLSKMRALKHPALVVILAGFALSLSIECLQWFLPTRDSDMTDVMTNTLGTALGVVLYRLRPVHSLFNRFSS